MCPVIDAEHQLERKGQRASKKSTLPSKRNILMFMERVAVLRASARFTKNTAQIDKVMAVTNKMLAESAELLKMFLLQALRQIMSREYRDSSSHARVSHHGTFALDGFKALGIPLRSTDG